MSQINNDAASRLRYAFNYPTQFQPTVTPQQAAALRGLLALFPDEMTTSGPSAFAAAGQVPFLPPPMGYNPAALAMAMGFLGRCPCRPNLSALGGASFGMGMCFQMLFMQASIVPMKACKLEKPANAPDEFATHQSCRTGLDNPSNLNDADHLKLAIYQTLQRSSGDRGGFKAMAPAELQTRLKEDYGIESELTKVKTKSGDEITALKFANGKMFADGAGDGQLDMGDYNFKGAMDDMKTRLGMSDGDLSKVDEAMRAQFTQQKEFTQALEKIPGFKELPPEMKTAYTQLLGGGQFSPNAAEAAFAQATGQGMGFPHGGMFEGQFQVSIFAMMLQAYHFAS
jgi:hypothetical protein